MDKPTSHFYKGIGPNERNCLNNYDDGDDNYSTQYNHHQQQQPTCSVNMNVQYHENWKVEDVECKKENEAMNLDSYLENGHFGSSDNYNDTFHYGYNNTTSNNSNTNDNNNISPFYHPGSSSLYRGIGSNSSSSSNQTGSSVAYSPYQISSATKSQLPAWYEPPSVHNHRAPMQHHHHPFAPPPPHPSYYQQQQQPQPPANNFYPYQANYQAVSSDHNMRNMIQMTNRYSRLSFVLFILPSLDKKV